VRRSEELSRYAVIDFNDLIRLKYHDHKFTWSINQELVELLKKLSANEMQRPKFAILAETTVEGSFVLRPSIQHPHVYKFDDVLAWIKKKIPWYSDDLQIFNYSLNAVGQPMLLVADFADKDLMFFSSNNLLRNALKELQLDCVRLYQEAELDDEEWESLITYDQATGRVIIYLDVDSVLLNRVLSKLRSQTVLNDHVVAKLKELKQKYPNAIWRILTARVPEQAPSETHPAAFLFVELVKIRLQQSVDIHVEKIIYTGEEKKSDKVVVSKAFAILEDVKVQDLIIFVDDSFSEHELARYNLHLFEQQGASLHTIVVHSRGDFPQLAIEQWQEFVSTESDDDEMELGNGDAKEIAPELAARDAVDSLLTLPLAPTAAVKHPLSDGLFTTSAPKRSRTVTSEAQEEVGTAAGVTSMELAPGQH
jgi:hypothetical protein